MTDDFLRVFGRKYAPMKPTLKRWAEGWPLGVEFSDDAIQSMVGCLRETLAGVIVDRRSALRAEQVFIECARDPRKRGSSVGGDLMKALRAASAADRAIAEDPEARAARVEHALQEGRQLDVHEFGLAQIWAQERVERWRPTSRWERQREREIRTRAEEGLERFLIDRTLTAPAGGVDSPGGLVRKILEGAKSDLWKRDRREAVVGTDPVDEPEAPQEEWSPDASLRESQIAALEQVKRRVRRQLNEPNRTRALDLLDQALAFARGRQDPAGLLAWQVLKPVGSRAAVPAARRWLQFYVSSSANPRAGGVKAESFDKSCGKKLRKLYARAYGDVRARHLSSLGVLSLFGLTAASFASINSAVAAGIDPAGVGTVLGRVLPGRDGSVGLGQLLAGRPGLLLLLTVVGAGLLQHRRCEPAHDQFAEVDQTAEPEAVPSSAPAASESSLTSAHVSGRDELLADTTGFDAALYSSTGAWTVLSRQMTGSSVEGGARSIWCASNSRSLHMKCHSTRAQCEQNRPRDPGQSLSAQPDSPVDRRYPCVPMEVPESAQDGPEPSLVCECPLVVLGSEHQDIRIQPRNCFVRNDGPPVRVGFNGGAAGISWSIDPPWGPGTSGRRNEAGLVALKRHWPALEESEDGVLDPVLDEVFPRLSPIERIHIVHSTSWTAGWLPTGEFELPIWWSKYSLSLSSPNFAIGTATQVLAGGGSTVPISGWALLPYWRTDDRDPRDALFMTARVACDAPVAVHEEWKDLVELEVTQRLLEYFDPEMDL